jgi:hypothetical protein
MKLQLPKFLRKRKRSVTPPIGHGTHDLSRQLFQALIDIRDQPKHARRKAKEALAGPRPWRYLYRELLNVQANPAQALEIARRAILEAQIAMHLHAALIEIRKNPKNAQQLAAVAVVEAARRGSSRNA